MSPDRIDAFAALLADEFPRYLVVSRPYQSPDDPTITRFLHLLDVPSDQLANAEERAWELAERVFGDEVPPFCMTALNPEASRRYFPEQFPRASAG